MSSSAKAPSSPMMNGPSSSSPPNGPPIDASAPPPPPAKGGASDFLNRAGFTLLMAYSMLALVAQGIRYLIPVVLLIESMMYYEVVRINQKERKDRHMPYFRLLPWYFLGVTIFTGTGFNMRDVLIRSFGIASWYHHFGLAVFALYCFGFVCFVLTLRRGMYKYQIGQFTWMSMTLIFIIGQGSLQLTNMLNGMFFWLLPVSCVVHNDVWAYACGKLFGRTKLLALSPKKTLEGFIGSCIMTLIWAFWFAGYMPRFQQLVCPERDLSGPVPKCEIDPVFVPVATPLPALITSLTGVQYTFMVSPIQLHALVFGAFASIVAPFGGFFASGLKRAFKLKDFGTLIPGHGGMTDRMDCQIIMGLFTFVYTQTVIFREATCPSPGDLVACLKALPASDLADVLKQVTGKL